MASAQVPLSSTLPSGQVHLAPVGLSRHMKSQVILRHGLEAEEGEQKCMNIDVRLMSHRLSF